MRRLEEGQDESYYQISHCYRSTKGAFMIVIVFLVYNIFTLLS